MNHPLVTLKGDETVEEAARAMDKGQFGFIGVEGEGGELVGVVTDRDLAVRVCARGLPSELTKLAEVMTPQVVSCSTRDSVKEAEKIMAQHKVQRIVVVDGSGAPVGVLSLSDLAQCEPPIRVANLVRDVTSREFRYKGRLTREKVR